MDNRRFDELTRDLVATGSRRFTIRALVGGALAAGMARFGPAAAAKCKTSGKNCDKDGDCCSKRCKNGKCRCAKPGQSCQNSTGCCSSVCGAGGTCCKFVTELCKNDNDCCFDDTECQAYPGDGPKRCCLQQGATCFVGGSEACCNGLLCDVGGTNRCVVAGGISCLHNRETCAKSSHCCGSLACCSQNCCGELCGEQRCCQPAGGGCTDDADCCFADSSGQCQTAPGGGKRCCNRQGGFCATTGDCCNGLFCDEDDHTCVELGVAP